MGKLDVQIKAYEKNPAMVRIIRMFEDAFNSIGEKIRADLLKAYRNYARESFNEFMTAAGTRDGDISRRGDKFHEFKGWSHYVKIDRTGLAGSYSAYPRTWAEIRSLKGRLSVDYTKADESANYSYENARDSFVYKNIGKISNVLGARQDLKNAVMKFDWHGNYFKGNLQVYLEGAYFRGDVDVKYVIRRIPNVTPYFQYPLVFVEAEITGKHYARPSEDELRVLLGATKSAAQEKKESDAAAGFCPMSGQSAGKLSGERYGNCPTCRAYVSIQHYSFRKHKTPAAEKAATTSKLTDAGYCPKSREKVSPETIATIPPVVGYSDPKIICEGCGQLARLDARKDWIFDGVPEGGHATRARVTSAVYYKHKLPVKNNPDTYLLDDKPVDRETWKKGWDCMHCSKRYSTDRKVVNHEYKVHKVQKPGAGGGGQASWPGQRPWGWGRGAK